MSNISPINAKPPATKTSTLLSRELRELLGSARTADDAVAGALACPALIDQARDALPALWHEVEAAGDAAVVKVITARLPMYPQSQRTTDEWANWWGGYFRVLSDQPAAALEAGMCEWEKTDTTGFLPKPGQLLALVKTAAEPHWQALSRANRIAKLEPPTAAQLEPLEVRQAMAEKVRQVFAIKPGSSAFSESTDRSSINVPNQENENS